MIIEEFDEAIQELKRADHSIFATLKYTRSADVVIAVLERLSKTCACAVHAGLIFAKEKNAISEIPPDAKNREKVFREVYPQLREYMDLYAFLRKVLQLREYTCEEEFRKNLTLLTQVDGQDVKITVDDVEAYYFKIKQFLNDLKQIFMEAPL